MCAELANRGAKDVPIIYCGGLSGFPEAIEATLLDEGASPAEVITKHVIGNATTSEGVTANTT